jgi:hypothetical protein
LPALRTLKPTTPRRPHACRHRTPRGEGHQALAPSPKREEFFGPLGVTNIRTFVDPQNPARVAVLMYVPYLDALTAALQTEAAAAAMANDGVLAETLVMVVEA